MEYFEKFIGYALKTCTTMDELTDRNARQKHNRAMASLYRLMHDRMYAEPDRSADIALRLMEHPDARVRLNAAAYCLQAEVHTGQATALLQQLSQDDPNDLIRLNAELSAMCCVSFPQQKKRNSVPSNSDGDWPASV